jgi:transposase InsO family protein
MPDARPIDGILKAKSPNHMWMMDITEIPCAFRLFTFKFVVLLDVFSRFPVAAKLFFKEPAAREIADFLRAATNRHGLPKHFVSDKGSQFTSQHFCATLKRLAIKQRFGAIGEYGSISIIERFWRTLKDLLLLRRAWSPGELVHRLNAGLYYYAFHKPHQGLNGATPAEIFFGLRPANSLARRPLREFELARKKKLDQKTFEIRYLDQERLLPVLVPTKKAA